MYDTGFNSSFSSGEGSFYYSGHLALLKHGQLKYIQESRIDYSSTIIKRLNLYYSEIEQFLSSSDFFNKLLEEFESTGYFFDTRLENVLDSIRRYYSEIAVVLESNGDFYNKLRENPQESPLGNAAYSKYESNIFVMTNTDSVDKDSIYWNTACGITLESEDSLPFGRSSYIPVSVANLDPQIIQFEVQAITGLKAIYFNTGRSNKSTDAPDATLPSPNKTGNGGPSTDADFKPGTTIENNNVTSRSRKVSSNRKKRGMTGRSSKRIRKANSISRTVSQVIKTTCNSIVDAQESVITAANVIDTVKNIIERNYAHPKDVDYQNVAF
jgi:hypothetical protein